MLRNELVTEREAIKGQLSQIDNALQRRNELVAKAILLRDIFDANQGHRNETGRAPMAILVDYEYQVIGF
jgi:hypothetical protein